MSEPRDPATLLALADATVQRAAEALRTQVKEVAALIDPFPPFPGAVFAYGIEVEPPGGGDPDLGCVILGNDGALYELSIGLDTTQTALGAGASGERHEDLRPLDLPPERYIPYAHAAIATAAAYLEGGRR
ncbi:MAG: hypothetical protein M0R73_11550 [Dehalococcoidia bacterium]|nr:hypothetical protein [Dehalococcoidia bacterium]